MIIQYPTIKILSQQLELLGITELYTSLRFARSWQSCGEFEIHVSDSAVRDILIPGNLIMLDNDVDRTGIINSVRITHDNGIVTVIKGYHLNGITTRRIVLPYEGKENGGYFCVPKILTLEDEVAPVAAETIFKTFVRAQFPLPEGNNPRALNLYIPPDQQRGLHTVWLSRYDQLSDILQDIGEYTDMGYRIYPDFDNNRFVFDVVTGVDRTVGQSQNPYVIMSRDYESVTDIIYEEDVSSQKNVAYAGGAGEDYNRTVIAVTNEYETPIGLNRMETFVDCGTLEAAETDETLSLIDEGKHKLLDYKKQESLTATISQSGSFIYRQDWDLGDLVTVADKKMGVEEDKRITAVEECYEPQTKQLKVTFGTAAEHLNRIIRRNAAKIR